MKRFGSVLLGALLLWALAAWPTRASHVPGHYEAGMKGKLIVE